jgi:hypothetical protein
MEKLSNGNIISYKILYETAYHAETPDRVVYLLHTARSYGTRLKIHYGDTKTGKLWGDIISCYVGRSTGTIKIPLAIYNKRSTGGCDLLDNCIVKIEYANKKRGGVLYDITK